MPERGGCSTTPRGRFRFCFRFGASVASTASGSFMTCLPCIEKCTGGHAERLRDTDEGRAPGVRLGALEARNRLTMEPRAPRHLRQAQSTFQTQALDAI